MSIDLSSPSITILHNELCSLEYRSSYGVGWVDATLLDLWVFGVTSLKAILAYYTRMVFPFSEVENI